MTAVLRDDRFKGILISFFAHIALFVCGGFVFAKPIEYAVEIGTGGVELSLIAAPAEPVMEDQIAIEEPPEPVEQERPVIPQPEDMPLPQHDAEEQKSPEPKVPEEKKEVQAAANSLFKGDGSSPVPGKDATTFYSSSGAITEAKPNYLKNPAPPYPLEAREKGWQGIVILKVAVDKFGRPMQVEKEQGSGYVILDEAALKAVKKWRFRPAQLGAIPIKSSVRVPIRFQIENLKQPHYRNGR